MICLILCINDELRNFHTKTKMNLPHYNWFDLYKTAEFWFQTIPIKKSQMWIGLHMLQDTKLLNKRESNHVSKSNKLLTYATIQFALPPTFGIFLKHFHHITFLWQKQNKSVLMNRQQWNQLSLNTGFERMLIWLRSNVIIQRTTQLVYKKSANDWNTKKMMMVFNVCGLPLIEFVCALFTTACACLISGAFWFNLSISESNYTKIASKTNIHFVDTRRCFKNQNDNVSNKIR